MSERTERLQVEITEEDLARIDDFQFDNRIPTRAAAIRELLRRGLETFKRQPKH